MSELDTQESPNTVRTTFRGVQVSNSDMRPGTGALSGGRRPGWSQWGAPVPLTRFRALMWFTVLNVVVMKPH